MDAFLHWYSWHLHYRGSLNPPPTPTIQLAQCVPGRGEWEQSQLWIGLNPWPSPPTWVTLGQSHPLSGPQLPLQPVGKRASIVGSAEACSPEQNHPVTSSNPGPPQKPKVPEPEGSHELCNQHQSPGLVTLGGALLESLESGQKA